MTDKHHFRFFGRRFGIALLAITVAAGSGKFALGARLDVFLTIDVNSHTWELAASTDSPGGISTFHVNLINFGTGTSIAPRSAFDGAALLGFKVGNLDLPLSQFQPNEPLYGHAFVGQLPLNTSDIVYGIGYAPVPDSAFEIQPPIQMIGSALKVPTVMFVGSYDPANGLPDFNSHQDRWPGTNNYNVGSVYSAPPPPGGYDSAVRPSDITLNVQTTSLNVVVVPEPTGWLVLMGSAVWLHCAAKRRYLNQ